MRLDVAIEHARSLEASIANARKRYDSLDDRAVSILLEPLIQELFATRKQINEELGIEHPMEKTATVWLDLVGGRVGEGKAPVAAIGRVLGSLQTATKQLAAYMETGQAKLRRVPNWVSDQVLLDLVAFQPGSARIGIAPEYPQLRVEYDAPLADEVIRRFVDGVQWAQAEGTLDKLEQMFPSAALRRQMMSRIKELAPHDEGDYLTVKIYGPSIPETSQRTPIIVSKRARESAVDYLSQRIEEPVEYPGQLVAIDIEKEVFALRYEGGRVPCHFGEELHERAKNLIEHYVFVKGAGQFREGREVPEAIVAHSLRSLTAVEIKEFEETT